MKRKFFIAVLLGLTIVSIICIILYKGYNGRFKIKYNEFSCGIKCLEFVFHRLGIDLTQSDIKRFRKYSKMEENNMFQLFNEIKKKGLNVIGTKINLEDIVDLNTIAIVHLWTNHFVVIEPTNIKKKIRVYDPLNNKIKEVDIEKFKNYYSGYALLISKNEINIPNTKIQNPDIRFNNYIYNFQEVEEGTKIPFKFTFINYGEEPLEIFKIRKSCGCIVMDINKRKFFKREKGVIKGIFNTEKRMGFQREIIFVHTNDPITPIINLIIEGFVKEKIYIIPEIIRFGEIREGEKKEKEIYVVNPKKDRKFKIVKIESSLSPILKWEILRSTNQIRPGYKIRFLLQNEIPMQDINGEVIIFTNDKNHPQISIPVIGKVKKGVEIYPELCFFYGNKKTEKIKITFENKPTEIERIETTSSFIKPKLISLNEKEYIMEILLDTYPEKLIKEKVYLNYKNNEKSETIEIPVYGIIERR